MDSSIVLSGTREMVTLAAETLTVGREAIRERDWEKALEALDEVDREDGLGPDDLMLLGDALWWSSQPDRALDAFGRAYESFVEEKRLGDAATVGALLAYFALRRMAISVAMGWVARVENLLDGQPESNGHAWLKIIKVAKALFVDWNLEGVVEEAQEAIEIALRHNVVGVQALAMSLKGIAMAYRGEWRDGVALVDEASALAMSRGDDLRASSDVYCNMMGVCTILGDYRRAGEWTEEAERWMRNHSVGGFTGVCQVHRAQLKRLRGAWPEAEREARGACTELEKFHMLNGIGYAHYEIGEVRRRMGDLDAAEESFMRAYQYGHAAQPGMALLAMDRGDLAEAAKSIAGALAAVPAAGSPDLLSRAHLLPASAEIAVAARDFDTAREAVGELEDIARIYESPTWEATALTCRGSLELEEGNARDALDLLDRAWRLWQGIDLPYESARTRELLGRARIATGDERAAQLEFQAVQAVYHRLGARTDLERLQQAVDLPAGDTPNGERLTKAFMFTDIVTSTDLIGLIGDEAWERLLAWHDRELREIIARHRGEVVRHTGDGFFVTFDPPRDAVDCAVAIQRRLADHRLEHGFSPTVRIGAHLAEATKHANDYSGVGVHVAARIGNLGGGEEIVVSSELLKAAGPLPYPLSSHREVELKGVTEPVRVDNVIWRA
jgi:class 3 adenylate cyclase